MSLNRERIRLNSILLCGMLASGLVSVGCTRIDPPPTDNGGTTDFPNTTDPTNNGASFVGSAACGACHSGISEQHSLHGHAHQLNEIQGVSPEYPAPADRAGVPGPPVGYEWSDIAFVIGGHTRRANFVDLDGYVLTTGATDVATQWNLSFPANGNLASFVEYESEGPDPNPYDFSCFECHTTGPTPTDGGVVRHQENRPGIVGTWQEAGVQCEACHGPGSNHLPNPQARDLFVGNSAQYCAKCHSSGANPNIIPANGGFISRYGQYQELLASGGHADFSCVICHNPHSGTNYDRANAIRNECTSCHSDHDMAIHDGLTFVRGDYSEEVSCVSCHMPFATRSATSAGSDVVGSVGRIGDVRTHIFRINTDPVDYRSFFSADGTVVAQNADGLAAVTIDFVCFRCHNGIGNAGTIDSLELASGVADGMHSIVRPIAKRHATESK